MAKTKLNVTNLGNVCYTNSKEIIARMQEISNKLPEAPVAEKVLITLELNALVKALAKLLSNNLNCSDDMVKETLTNSALADTSIVIGINDTDYIYSKEEVKEPEVDKAFLTSEGCKTLKAYHDKLVAEGKPIPSCINVATKTIISFKPEAWQQEPLAKEVTADVISIKEKENKNK